MPHVLVLMPSSNTLSVDQLREKFPAKQIMLNSVVEGDDVIAVMDARHEGDVPDRWPEQIIVIGDTLTRFKDRISYRLPIVNAQRLLFDLLTSEEFAQEEEASVAPNG